MDIFFAQIGSWIVAIVLAAAMFGGWAVGWWVGRRNPADPNDQCSSRFIDASLALFGLLIGFTFSMALSRHDTRRLMVVADSNSIGDFYTCASLLKDPQRTQLQDVIREYVNIRLSLLRGPPDPAATEKSLAESARLQTRMTNIVGDAVNSGTPVTIPLVTALNNLTSNHASLLAAMRDRLPLGVLALLFVAGISSTILVGRYYGARQNLRLSGTVIYVVLAALAAYIILDLNQPFQGVVQVSYEPLERLASSIAK